MGEGKVPSKEHLSYAISKHASMNIYEIKKKSSLSRIFFNKKNLINVLLMSVMIYNSVIPLYSSAIEMGELGIKDIYFAGIYTGLILSFFYVIPVVMHGLTSPLRMMVYTNFIVLVLLVIGAGLRFLFGEEIN